MEKQKQEYEKSGQMNGSVGTIVMLVTGVGVAVLVMIFVGALGGQTYNLVEDDINELTATVTNESVTVLNSTAVSLANDDVVTGSLSVLNNSNTVALSKFTVDYSAGTVTLLDNNFNNTALDISYTHGEVEAQRAIQNGIISGFNALEDTGGYVPLIVLAIVIVVILGLVLGFQSLGGNSGGRTSAL